MFLPQKQATGPVNAKRKKNHKQLQKAWGAMRKVSNRITITRRKTL